MVKRMSFWVLIILVIGGGLLSRPTFVQAVTSDQQMKKTNQVKGQPKNYDSYIYPLSSKNKLVNVTRIDVRHGNNRATIQQWKTSSNSYINQVGLTNKKRQAQIIQLGEDNVAHILQEGTWKVDEVSFASIKQKGNGNIGYIEQWEKNNYAVIEQIGNNNQTVIKQLSKGHQFLIKQYSNNGNLTIIQN